MYLYILQTMDKKFKVGDIRFVMGLGNPGPEYQHTYHNAGLLFLQYLLQQSNLSSFRRRSGLYSRIILSPSGVSFIFPTTYMNQSGRAVSEIVAEEQTEHFLLVHDDSDLPLGEYQFAFGKRSAGHRGVTSVISAFHTSNFSRLRIGIRDKEARVRKKAEEIVLQLISSHKLLELEAVFQTIIQEHELFSLLS